MQMTSGPHRSRHKQGLSSSLHESMLLPENVTEKNNGFTKPANMPHLDIVQKADCKADITNSLMGILMFHRRQLGPSKCRQAPSPL